jgi:hypothetical protein
MRITTTLMMKTCGTMSPHPECASRAHHYQYSCLLAPERAC